MRDPLETLVILEVWFCDILGHILFNVYIPRNHVSTKVEGLEAHGREIHRSHNMYWTEICPQNKASNCLRAEPKMKV